MWARPGRQGREPSSPTCRELDAVDGVEQGGIGPPSLHHAPQSANGAADAAIFPTTVWLILASEFGERFSFYGLRAILALYFLSLGYSEEDSVALFAYTTALAYMMPMIG